VEGRRIRVGRGGQLIVEEALSEIKTEFFNIERRRRKLLANP
jgi:hypothetical protein